MSKLSSTEIFQMTSSVRLAVDLGVTLRALAGACPCLGALDRSRDVKAIWVEQGHALEALADVIEDGLRNGSTDMATDLGRDWLRGVLRTVGLLDGMLRSLKASVGHSDAMGVAKRVIGTADLLVDRMLTLQASIASFNRVKDYAPRLQGSLREPTRANRLTPPPFPTTHTAAPS